MANSKSLGILTLPDVGNIGLQKGIWRAVSELNKGNEISIGVDYNLIECEETVAILARLQNAGACVRIHEFKQISSDFIDDVALFGWRFEPQMRIYQANDEGISFLDLDKVVLIANNSRATIFHPNVELEIISKSNSDILHETLKVSSQKKYHSKYFAIRELLLTTLDETEAGTCFCLDTEFHTFSNKVELDDAHLPGVLQ